MATIAITPNDRLSFTLFLAASLHAAIILGVGFSQELDLPDSITIEVTLAQFNDPEAPEDADFIAQANQAGSGLEDEVHELTALQEADFPDTRFQQVSADPLPALPQITLENEEILTAISSEIIEASAEEAAPLEPLAAQSISNPLIDALAKEIASLEARIAFEENAKARSPRVKRLTSVSTKTADEAAYLNLWRQKVEQVGNANYPAGVYGNLRMLVVLKYDGKLTDVRILESSGAKLLDDAALNIVRIAAPFQNFPVEMRKRYDQLEIIRTWKFSRAGARLGI
jgi:protein TonB